MATGAAGDATAALQLLFGVFKTIPAISTYSSTIKQVGDQSEYDIFRRSRALRLHVIGHEPLQELCSVRRGRTLRCQGRGFTLPELGGLMCPRAVYIES